MSEEAVDTSPEQGAVQEPSVDPGAEPQQESHPFAEQFKSMEDRLIGHLDERLTPAEPDEPEGSLSDQLMYEPDQGYDGEMDNEVDRLLADDENYYDDGQFDLAAFDELVDERVQEALEPFQQEQRAQELDALQDKYPDITSPKIMAVLEDKLGGMVERHQNSNLATDPAVVEMVYKSAKAELESAEEVPAELAATREASLETGAGPSRQGAADPDDEYRKGLMGSAAGGDAFT